MVPFTPYGVISGSCKGLSVLLPLLYSVIYLMLFPFESAVNSPPIKTWFVFWMLIVFTIPDDNPGCTPAPMFIQTEPV